MLVLSPRGWAALLLAPLAAAAASVCVRVVRGVGVDEGGVIKEEIRESDRRGEGTENAGKKR